MTLRQQLGLPPKGQLHRFTTYSLILSPLHSGRAMFTAPSIVAQATLMWLTGEDHPADCPCEVCKYLRDESTHHDQVRRQRNDLIERTPIRYVMPRNDLGCLEDPIWAYGLPDEGLTADWVAWFRESYPMVYDSLDDEAAFIREVDGAGETFVYNVMLVHILGYYTLVRDSLVPNEFSPEQEMLLEEILQDHRDTSASAEELLLTLSELA